MFKNDVFGARLKLKQPSIATMKAIQFNVGNVEQLTQKLTRKKWAHGA